MDLQDRSDDEQKHPEMPKKPLTPYFRYFLENREKYSEENPEMSMTDLAKLLSQKYLQLPDKKRQNYIEAYEKENELFKQNLENFKKCHPEKFPTPEMKQAATTSEGPDKPHTSFNIFVRKRLKSLNSASKHETTGKKKLCKEEPRRPPQSGYGLFSSEKLGELTHIDPKDRMTEIAKLWKSMSSQEKDVYSKRVQELMRKYNKEMQKFLKGLTFAEFQEYDKSRKSTMKKKSKKVADGIQKTVKKETDIESSDEESSSDDDDDSEKSDGDDSGSGLGSGSSSGSDDSGSDSGSDDDDDDDDESEVKDSPLS